MRDVLDRADFCSYLLVLICAITLARLAGRIMPRFARASWWAASVVLLGIVAIGYGDLRPRNAADILGLVVIGGIAAAAAALTVTTVLAPLAAVWDWEQRKRAALNRLCELEESAERERMAAEERWREQQSQLEAQERARRNQPPPPTREQTIAAAQRRHQQTVRMLTTAGLDEMELRAAMSKAKQSYLKELERLMQ